MNGKGDKNRTSDKKQFDKNYDRIFGGKMEWISVKDKLPNNGDAVLIIENNIILVALYYQVEPPWCWDIPDGICYCTANIDIKPTHWMPLPKPPEE